MHTGAYKSIWHALGKIVHEEGMGALYRGLLPTLIGLVPYSAAYYFVYDTLTREYRQLTKKKQLDSVEILCIGAFAGTSVCSLFPRQTFGQYISAETLVPGQRSWVLVPSSFLLSLQ